MMRQEAGANEPGERIPSPGLGPLSLLPLSLSGSNSELTFRLKSLFRRLSFRTVCCTEFGPWSALTHFGSTVG